jgi:hypothetical protein
MIEIIQHMLGICPESGQHINLLIILNELSKIGEINYIKLLIRNILK